MCRSGAIRQARSALRPERRPIPQSKALTMKGKSRGAMSPVASHVLTPLIGVSLTLLLLGASGSSDYAQTRLEIFFAESPAFLIRIDGDPVYSRIEGTDLERIVNTKVLIVRDRADIHYLKALDGWMEAYGLTGDWSVSGITPFGERTTLERAIEAQTVDLLDGS